MQNLPDFSSLSQLLPMKTEKHFERQQHMGCFILCSFTITSYKSACEWHFSIVAAMKDKPWDPAYAAQFPEEIA